MRKRLSIMMAFLLALAMMLAGCSGNGIGGAASNPDEEAIRAAVDGFLGSLKEGNYDGLGDYVTDEVASSDDFKSISDLVNLSDTLAQSMGLGEEALSDTTKALLDDFINTLKEKLVSGYEITEISQDGDTATAKGTLTLGFDPDEMDSLMSGTDVEKLATDYMSEHMDELMTLYNEQGEEAMMNKMLEDLLPEMTNVMKEAMDKSEPTTEDFEFNLEKKDDKWLISDLEGIMSSDTGESTSGAETAATETATAESAASETETTESGK